MAILDLFGHKYPSTDFHELNLDWCISAVLQLQKAFEDFSAGNKLTFADPLQHDLTKTYAKNTIVIGASGTAYLSLDTVPKGVQLSDEDYWLPVFDFAGYIMRANKNFTNNYFSGTDRSPVPLSVGDWVVLDDVLYKVTSAIAADDLFIVDTNIVHFTIEQFLKDFTTQIVQTVNQYKADIDASELLYKQQLAQDIADTTASLQAQLDAAISGATADSEVINARVGANGITYGTLGEADRTQFNDLNEIIDNSLDNAQIVLTPGYVIITNSSPISLTPTANASYNCAVIDCEAGDLFTLNLEGGGASALGYVFIDSSNNPITSSGKNVILDNFVVCAPDTAKKLIINTKNDGVSFKGLSIYKEKNYFENMIGDHDKVVLYDEFTSNPTNYAQSSYAWVLDFDVNNARYVTLKFTTDDEEKVTFYPLKLVDTDYKILDAIDIICSSGLNLVTIDLRSYSGATTIAVRAYNSKNSVPYELGGDKIPFRIAIADLIVGNVVTPTQGSATLYFDYKIVADMTLIGKNHITVDINGNGDYVDVVEAFEAADDGDTIFIKSGTYHLDNGISLNPNYKKLYIIGQNRDDTIIESNDGRYAYSLLYLTSGLVENITLQCKYVAGISHDISGETNGQYALHTEGSTGKNKKLTIRNAKLISDFFSAYGCGMSEGMELTIENSQFITNAPLTSDTNDYGAMYLHDCGYELQNGNSYLNISNSTFEARRNKAIGLSHTNSYGNPVITKFISNTTYSDQNGLNNNVLLRHSPYSNTFTMSGMSWNNSDSDLDS